MVRLLPVSLVCLAAFAADADLILHNAKVVTVDARFSLAQAVAIRGNIIVAVGSDADVLKRERGPKTRLMDLHGKMVLPGLIDAHVHALESGLTEFRGKLPPLASIVEIQDYIRTRARSTPKGAWIVVPRTMVPRLKEMRMPTRADLDVTTDHPVAFDASYVWSSNTLALKISGITRDTPNPPGGEIVKDANGEPNGILRNASQLLKGVVTAAPFTDDERLAALEQMLTNYAKAGLTTVGDRLVGAPEVKLFERLKADGRLPVRVVLTWRVPTVGRPVADVVNEIKASPWTTNYGDEWLKMGTFKVTLDGGNSVGTAYQRMPYGPFGRQLYGQTNPDARGTLFVPHDDLVAIFSAARDKGWQLTAHAQGGGAIDALLDAFEALDKVKPIAPTRSHVMHGSFQNEASLDRMKRLGILADVQPGWLYYDMPAYSRVFDDSSLKTFYPLRSYLDRGIVMAAGSDQMSGLDKRAAINPYDPFFSMWMSITRRTTEGKVSHPEQCITRQEALRMYTTGAAYMQFSEKTKGSLEVGKLADLVVIDRDFLTCPEDEIRVIEPLLTMIDGKVAYRAIPAFPGAEGFGAQTPGGRGGRVLTVENLNDSGPGSLREAIQTKGKRIVVFAVSGTIELKSELRVTEPYITIAGQSAPGEGVQLKGAGILIATHDAVVRYLRSRPGDVLGEELDAIGVGGTAHDVVIDHCSASCSVDEALSPSGAIENVTVQWSLIGESLNNSVHKKGPHGYGSLVRAVGGLSMHHNLWVKNNARNPRLGDNYQRPPWPTFDIRNNVMALWGDICSGMTGDEISTNYVANYLKPGPDSKQRPPIVLTDTAHVHYYLEGNVMEGRPEYSKNDAAMFTPAERDGRKLFEVVAKPFKTPPVTMMSARDAYEAVLADAGATRPARDAMDARIVAEVRAGQGKLIDSQRQVGGWPVYKPAVAPVDSDHDGIPDGWERAHGLNPNDPSDAALVSNGDGYTNIEKYLNELARGARR
jgi:predicted amidohydrolase YtcJ